MTNNTNNKKPQLQFREPPEEFTSLFQGLKEQLTKRYGREPEYSGPMFPFPVLGVVGAVKEFEKEIVIPHFFIHKEITTPYMTTGASIDTPDEAIKREFGEQVSIRIVDEPFKGLIGVITTPEGTVLYGEHPMAFGRPIWYWKDGIYGKTKPVEPEAIDTGYNVYIKGVNAFAMAPGRGSSYRALFYEEPGSIEMEARVASTWYWKQTDQEFLKGKQNWAEGRPISKDEAMKLHREGKRKMPGSAEPKREWLDTYHKAKEYRQKMAGGMR